MGGRLFHRAVLQSLLFAVVLAATATSSFANNTLKWKVTSNGGDTTYSGMVNLYYTSASDACAAGQALRGAPYDHCTYIGTSGGQPVSSGATASFKNCNPSNSCSVSVPLQAAYVSDCVAGSNADIMRDASTSQGTIMCGSNSCEYLALRASNYMLAVGKYHYSTWGQATGASCTPPTLSDQEDAPAPGQDANKHCYTKDGVKACTPPSSTNCGQVNGDLVCATTVAPNECMTMSSGAMVCGATAALTSPPAPNNGSSTSQPATPDVQFNTTNNSTTNNNNYYTSTTVNNQTSGSSSSGSSGSSGSCSSANGDLCGPVDSSGADDGAQAGLDGMGAEASGMGQSAVSSVTNGSAAWGNMASWFSTSGTGCPDTPQMGGHYSGMTLNWCGAYPYVQTFLYWFFAVVGCVYVYNLWIRASEAGTT